MGTDLQICPKPYVNGARPQSESGLRGVQLRVKDASLPHWRDPSLPLFEVALFGANREVSMPMCVRKHDGPRRLTRSASKGRAAIAADLEVDRSECDGV